MTAPLVSVLIPCFNAERTIEETLESVLAQTWPNIEVIVVDDGSTDGSVLKTEMFRARGVSLLKQSNSGASAARNAAYRASRGAFVQFLDADDLISSDKIERQITRLLAVPGAIASAEWARFFVRRTEANFVPEPVWRDLDPLDWLSLSRSDGQGMLFPAIWLAPRQVLDAAGPWDETLSLGDDGEYFTRVVLASQKVLFCPGARCFYRSGDPSSLSGRKSPAAWASAFRVIELCETNVLAHEGSTRMRCGFALTWQHFAHGCYPYNPVLADEAMARAAQLHGVRIDPDGGSTFRIVSRLLGWRLARRLQVISGRP